ncbi:MAG: hypothetical protein A4E26_00119 [Methanobacterium sp. PtaU1.Bin097]|nr:MAG: hypothetical protein A4E26_00119 [Methanobacterium sp. PtaU1.Bin097]
MRKTPTTKSKVTGRLREILAKSFSTFTKTIPSIIPMVPPRILMVKDSFKISDRIFLLFHPIARNTPISRVLSITDMIMVFITTILPTKMAINAMSEEIPLIN